MLTSKRMTNPQRWEDENWVNLSKEAKVLHQYLYETCDVAGFKTISKRAFVFNTNLNEEEVEAALSELSEVSICLSGNKKELWLFNFPVEQRNTPLNLANTVHKGIADRLLKNASQFAEHASKINLLEALNTDNKPIKFGQLFKDKLIPLIENIS